MEISKSRGAETRALFALALFVTPRGFEPPTNRTGICHSIQLNYGARGAKLGLSCNYSERTLKNSLQNPGNVPGRAEKHFHQEPGCS